MLIYILIGLVVSIIIPFIIAFYIFVFRFFRYGCIFFDNANYYIKHLIDKDKEIFNKKG